MLTQMSNPLVLVINMDRSHDRLQSITTHLDAQSIPFQRIQAIDGSKTDLSKLADAEGYRRCHGRDLRASEVGCYVSHLKAMTAFLETSETACVIFEDDARVCDDFIALVSEIIARNLCGFDMLRLQGRRQGLGLTKVRADRWSIKVHATRVTGSTAYVLTRKAAQRYLEKLPPMIVPFDHAFDRALHLGLRLGAVVPYPVGIADVPSTIETSVTTRRYGKATGIARWPVMAWRTQTEIARALACIAELPRITPASRRAVRSSKP